MSDLTFFWNNSDFHDATLLLGSDRELLEQSREALQDSFNSTKPTPKKRKTIPAAKAAKSTQSKGSSCSDHPTESSSGAASTPASCILTIPVHRIVLSLESAYFKTAISTLIGDSTAANGRPFAHASHPIIVVHEEDVGAAQGVLQFLYTKSVDSVFSTAPQLMHLLMVSKCHLKIRSRLTLKHPFQSDATSRLQSTI